MKRILPILKLVAKGLLVAAALSTMLINSAMAYIMFAPDDLPKPLYLAYSSPPGETMGATTAAAPAGGAGGGEFAPPPLVEATPAIPEPGDGFMFNTGTKIVNLADPGGRRYLKTTIVLEFAPPASLQVDATAAPKGEGEGDSAVDPATLFNDELNARLPVINDALTTLLSSKTFEQIYTIEGKEDLRQEILDTISERLPEYHVIYVYFTEFVVQ